eukprot:CAMPEP_0202082822 /NCGR_PEP_ID=MMETSP0964-20121228/21119_1 /ASSEMBLY_ACC=CAM_ASM_000500 /TAXON_ID=4773 /ORGANISM="Schizochytrium aggregatum, Strain ATCC28209" /LENGTH=98 /DNA_ID=CAMNT_0048650477 /DNA_START=770 /DNA_END=1063 /DNA_ORIENTATION=+
MIPLSLACGHGASPPPARTAASLARSSERASDRAEAHPSAPSRVVCPARAGARQAAPRRDASSHRPAMGGARSAHCTRDTHRGTTGPAALLQRRDAPE